MEMKFLFIMTENEGQNIDLESELEEVERTIEDADSE